MQIQWYRVNAAQLPRGVVVIDATPAAAPLLGVSVLSVLEAFREELPADAHPEVVYLGDRRCRPLAEVLAALGGEADATGPIACRQEIGRYPVIGPFFREWIRGSPRPVVLLANSVIEDLDDWATPEFAGLLVIYRLTGLDRLSRPPFREIGSDADPGVLVEHLRDPIQEVSVGGDGVFAVDWRPADLKWEGGSLRGTGAHAATLQVQLAHAEGCVPQARLRRTSGTVLKFPLGPAPAPAPTPILLSNADSSVMERWKLGRDFPCSECPVSHPPGQLRCLSGGRREIIPSLKSNSENTIWRLKRERVWNAVPATQGVEVYGETIVVNRGGEWSAFELENGAWKLVEAPPRFIAVGDDEYLFPA